MNPNQIHKIGLTLAALGLSFSLGAKSFDFKDPKGVNNVVFELDAPLEYISGTGNGISGTVEFDPAHPKKASGSITLATESLMVANSSMRDHMLGGKWLNAEEYPEIIFTASKLSDVSTEGTVTKATAHGEITVKGVTKKLEVPVTFTYLEGKLADRSNGRMKGDLLVLRSSFEILRSDFGINAGNAEDKVSDSISLKLSIAGMAPEM